MIAGASQNLRATGYLLQELRSYYSRGITEGIVTIDYWQEEGGKGYARVDWQHHEGGMAYRLSRIEAETKDKAVRKLWEQVFITF
jgi:hypothetical protein